MGRQPNVTQASASAAAVPVAESSTLTGVESRTEAGGSGLAGPQGTDAEAGKDAQTQGKEPEQQAPAAPEAARRWRARALCFDGTLYQPGAERMSMADLDPDVWEEL